MSSEVFPEAQTLFFAVEAFARIDEQVRLVVDIERRADA